MGLTNAARDLIAKAMTGEAFTPFDNAHAYIGVGDSAAAFVATQTDLQAGANKFRKAMNATYPQRVANAVTYKATFAAGEANYAWNEWGVFNGATGADTMLNRKPEALGIKLNTQIWDFSTTLTYQAA